MVQLTLAIFTTPFSHDFMVEDFFVDETILTFSGPCKLPLVLLANSPQGSLVVYHLPRTQRIKLQPSHQGRKKIRPERLLQNPAIQSETKNRTAAQETFSVFTPKILVKKFCFQQTNKKLDQHDSFEN